MTMTTERGPFLDIAEEDVRVGAHSGHYLIPNHKVPGTSKLFVSKIVQEQDSMGLAEKVRRSGWKPAIQLILARGALSTGGPAAYYNGVRVVPTTQTEQYVDDSSEGKESRPVIVTKPDWEYLKRVLEEKRKKNPELYDDPTLLIWDEMTETRRGAALAKKDAINGLGLNPDNVKSAMMYIKDCEPELEEGEETVNDILGVDFSIRPVKNLWLDHQTQLSHGELLVVQQDIREYMPSLQRAAWFFAQMLVPDPEMMERIVERSAA